MICSEPWRASIWLPVGIWVAPVRGMNWPEAVFDEDCAGDRFDVLALAEHGWRRGGGLGGGERLVGSEGGAGGVERDQSHVVERAGDQAGERRADGVIGLI
jgi:hypothetical protein